MYATLDEQLRLWADGTLQIVYDTKTLEKKLWNEDNGIWIKMSDEFQSVLDQLRAANKYHHWTRYDRI